MKRLVILTALFLAGCAAQTQHPTEAIVTGNHIGRAEAFTDAATSNVKAIKPHADDVGQALADSALSQLANGKAELHEASKANIQQAADFEAVTQNYTKLQNSTGVKVEAFVRRWLKIVTITIVSYAAIMFGLRLAAMFIAGPVGPILAAISSAMSPIRWWSFISRLFKGGSEAVQ